MTLQTTTTVSYTHLNNAFGGDLLIQSDLILNQRSLCIKAGLAAVSYTHLTFAR